MKTTKTMAYPPNGAASLAALGATPTANVMVVFGHADDSSDRQNHAMHAMIEAYHAQKLLRAAALDAHEATVGRAAAKAKAPRKRKRDLEHASAQDFVWHRLDPCLLGKSTSVRVIVQAHYVQKLFFDVRVTPLLDRWLALADTVAEGMRALFEHGINGWNAGMDASNAVVCADPRHNGPRVPFEAYWPFENYDRTEADPDFKDCFETAETRVRSRVSLAGAPEATARAWEAALGAHRRMLQLEAEHDLFNADDQSESRWTLEDMV